MRNLREKLNKENGFTLIEMLIVVAIIAILIAISIPMVNRSLERAREATDAANERAALGLAMVEVLSENKLGGVAPDATSGKVCAFYVINNSEGSFGTGAATAPTTPDAAAGGGYGKGTTLEVMSKADNAGKTILITYDSKATTDAGQFTVEWK